MYSILDLFSGIGGFSLGLHSASDKFYTTAFCEIEEFCQAVLKKNFKNIPIFSDIKELNEKTLKAAGAVKPFIITGGYPCQPFSVAGKRKGKDDPRNLWSEMFRLIKELKPVWVLAENVEGHIKLGLDEVLYDLESENYTTQTFIIPATGVGANHQRKRLWIVGYSQHNGSPTPEREGGLLKQPEEPKKQISIWESEGTSGASGDVANPDNEGVRSRIGGDDFDYEEESGEGGVDGEGSAGDDEWYDTSPTQDEGVDVSDTDDTRDRTQEHRVDEDGKKNIQGRQEHTQSKSSRHGADIPDPNGKGLQGQRKKYKLPKSKRKREIGGSSWWDVEPNVGRVAYGVPNRVFKLRALGNSIIPQIAQKIGYAIIEAEKNGYKEGSKF